MAPVFVAGASRVFTPRCLCLFEVRTHGSQLRGGPRASTSATDPREVFCHFGRHEFNLQKAAFIVKPLYPRNLRRVSTFSSLADYWRRTSHYAASIDSR